MEDGNLLNNKANVEEEEGKPLKDTKDTDMEGMP